MKTPPMRHRVRLLSGLLGAASLAILLPGCGSFSLPKVSLPKIEVPLHTVTVTLDQSGGTVEMRQDQELVVRLASMPPTGYEWLRSDATTGGVLTAVGERGFEREVRTSNEFESAGFDIWRFKPGATGRQTLRFESRRPRRLDPPIQEASFNIVVR